MIEESEVGVQTAVLGFTLRLLAGGPTAVEALARSGLLEKSISNDSPWDENDLLRIASLRDGFVVIGYFHGGSAGFMLGQMHAVGRGKVHLFLHRIWTQGKPEWSREADRFIDGVARSLGCDAISGIVPDRIVRAIVRRYGFERKGVLVMRELSNVLAEVSVP